MKYIQIFVTDMGKFKDRSRYEFVAEFVNEHIAGSYMKYMRDKARYSEKDIIIIESNSAVPDGKCGEVKCVCAVTGEYLPLAEYEIK